MEKKQYITPSLEVTDLRAINATMQHAFNEASMPSDKFNAPALRGTKSEVF